MPREKLARMEEAGPHILVAKLMRMLGKSNTSQLLIHNWCPHALVLPSLGQRRCRHVRENILVARLMRMLGKSDTSQLLIHNWCPHAFVLPSLGQRRCRHVRENNSVRPRIVSALFQWLKLIVSVDTI